MPSSYVSHTEYYFQCKFCDYKIKNNKMAEKLHLKYCPKNKEFVKDLGVNSFCGYCRKKNCKTHF